MSDAITLEHPRVQAAKERWDKYKRKRSHNLQFDDLFEYFRTDCISFAAIAEEGGITREGARQIYNTYFREFFGDKSGKDRVLACNREHRQVLLQQKKNQVLTDELPAYIASLARAAGYTVDAVSSTSKKSKLSVYSKQLLINNHRCSLHEICHAFYPSKTHRAYARLHVRPGTLASVYAAIVRVNSPEYVKRTFILPSQMLRTVYSQSWRSKGMHIYLPLEKLPAYEKGRRQIDYWQYENAWHLLK